MKRSGLPYKVYVFHRSYFCGKMLAYLRYKEIPHEPVYESLAKVGGKLMANTGLRQMPVVETQDGQWLQDTTPMMEWFETRFPQNAVLPGDPVLAFFTRLLEDYADEWLWRPAIYYRWMQKEDRYLYKNLFVNEFVGGFWGSNKISTWLGGQLIHKHQNDKFLFGDGITKANREHVESIYLNTLDRLEAIFQEQPYLLGDKPCFADFGFFGSMFWHFGNDPTPNRIMQERAPGVYEWVARLWNAKSSKFEGKEFVQAKNGVPVTWKPLLKDACLNYLPYLRRNAIEFRDGQKTFDTEIEGYRYPGVHVSPYRVWCRERLIQHFTALGDAEQKEVLMTLDEFNARDSLLADSEIKSNWDPEGISPLCKPGKVPFSHKLLARFTGSNHVRTRRVWDS